MANQYAVGAGGTYSAAATWESTPSAGDDTGPPGAGDDVFLVAASGNVALDSDESAVALGGFNMTDYTNTLTCSGVAELDIDGACILDGTIAGTANFVVSGGFTKTGAMTALPSTLTITLDGTGMVTCNSVLGGSVVINTAGTHTASDAAYWTDFTYTAGTYVPHANQYISGSYAGGRTMTETWTFTGTGSVANDTGTGFAHLRAGWGASAATTISGTTRCKKFSYGSGGGTVTGAAQLLVIFPDANDFFVAEAGAGTLNVNYIQPKDVPDGLTQGDIDFSDCQGGLTIEVVDAGTLTFTGEVTCGTLLFNPRCNAAGTGKVAFGAGGKLNMAGAGTVGLGNSSTAGRFGSLDLGNVIHKVAGSIVRRNAGDATNALDFGSCYLELTGGSMMGDGITCACDDGACHIEGGTLTNCADPSGAVHTHNATDGTGNHADYTFDAVAPPGSMAAMGVGY